MVTLDGLRSYRFFSIADECVNSPKLVPWTTIIETKLRLTEIFCLDMARLGVDPSALAGNLQSVHNI